MRIAVLIALCLWLGFFSIACGGGGGGGGAGSTTPPPTATLPAISITTTSPLPGSLQGHAYSTTLTAVNGQGALHWSIDRVSPTTSFVTGLSIDNNGVLSGMPTFLGTAGFVATVIDSSSPARAASANFNITNYLQLVSAPSQTSTVQEFANPFNVRSGIVGGFPPVMFSLSSGAMPPGLKFDSNGQLTGSAYATGTYQFMLSARDSYSPPETASQPFTLVVQPPGLRIANSLPASIPSNRPFSGRVIAKGGTPPYTFSFTGTLPAGLSFDATGTLGGTPVGNTFGNFNVLATDSSSPQQTATQFFNVTAEAPLGRNDSPATATPIDNGFYQASISPYIDPPNGVPTAGDHDYYKLVSVGGATVHVETNAKRSNSNNPLDTVIEIVDANGVRLNTCRQPGDTTSTFSGACINDDISATPHVQDSAIDFLVPGAISTINTFFVHVFDWRGDARPDMLYSLQVSGVVDPLVIVSPRAATRGEVYSQALTAMHTNGVVTWSIVGGSLPAGLSLASGVISGTATTDGSYSFTLQASDAGPPAQIAVAPETIVVGEPIKITFAGTMPSACLSQPYSFQIPTTGGTPPLSWGFQSLNWPSLNLNQSTGTFSGTPTITGTFTGRVFVGDAAQSSDSQNVTIVSQQCP